MLTRKNEGKTFEIGKLYAEFIAKLAKYWKENGAVKEVDERGLINAFTGSFILFSNYYKFENEYFNDILRVFIDGMVERYVGWIKIRKKEDYGTGF